MSVVGIGIDIVAVHRIADLLIRHGPRFTGRCFRGVEALVEDPDNKHAIGPDPAVLAGRWAAKEAFLKALGADVRPIPYRDIEVVSSFGQPARLILHGRAREVLALVGGNRIHLTLSQAGIYAVASVLIEE